MINHVLILLLILYVREKENSNIFLEWQHLDDITRDFTCTHYTHNPISEINGTAYR